jgi:sterol desaturase/sphingolipid hydroxylase (fatty acid hydroxylase superfamily)
MDSDIQETQGEWQPKDIKVVPWSVWPIKPLGLIRYFLNVPFTRPWDVVLMIIPIITWFFLTPDLSTMQHFEIGWIATIYFRNVCLLILVASGFHYCLYIKKTQGNRYKYNRKWPAKHRKFLFGDQIKDNIFWSIISGCTIWTCYEVVTYWLFANGYIPYLDWKKHPIYFLLLFISISYIRQFHFYFIHRPLHWKPLYKAVHYLHHRNSNPGPWSGLSMHPIEHLLYFSGVILHWVLISHPLHALYHLQQTALTGPLGHTGFETLVFGRNRKIHGSGDYFHYLHHRYFECNYGHPSVPLDKWFGTSHNGSPEAHKAMRLKRLRVHGSN